jgi:hypothetical protein
MRQGLKRYLSPEEQEAWRIYDEAKASRVPRPKPKPKHRLRRFASFCWLAFFAFVLIPLAWVVAVGLLQAVAKGL